MGLFNRSPDSKKDSTTNVIVKVGRHTQDFGDGSRLKSDIAVATSLPIEKINEIVEQVKNRLAQRRQPVLPHDITTTTHVVMLEMGLNRDANIFFNYIKDRFDRRDIPKEKITFVKCEYCGASNNVSNEECTHCHAPINKDKTGSKII
jgi:hypothetical protein